MRVDGRRRGRQCRRADPQVRQLPSVLLLLLLSWGQSPGMGRDVKIREVLLLMLLLLLLLLGCAEYKVLGVGNCGGRLVTLQDSHHGRLLGERRLEALDDGVHLAEAALNTHNGGRNWRNKIRRVSKSHSIS